MRLLSVCLLALGLLCVVQASLPQPQSPNNPSLKRTNTIDNINANNAPPLRRTKSSPAILSRMRWLTKDTTTEPSERFKGKYKWRLTGTLVQTKKQSRVKSDHVLLQLAADSKQSNAVARSFRKKKGLFFALYGAVVGFVFIRNMLAKPPPPRFFVSNMKDAIKSHNQWGDEKIIKSKDGKATIAYSPSKKQYLVVAENPQTLSEVGDEMQRVHQKVSQEIPTKLLNEVKENLKVAASTNKDVEMEIAKQLDKLPRTDNPNDPFDGISTENMLILVRHVAQLGDKVVDLAKKFDEVCNNALAKMEPWEQELYRMFDPFGGVPAEVIASSTLGLTKETSYVTDMKDTIEFGLNTIQEISNQMEKVSTKIEKSIEKNQGSPVFYGETSIVLGDDNYSMPSHFQNDDNGFPEPFIYNPGNKISEGDLAMFAECNSYVDNIDKKK